MEYSFIYALILGMWFHQKNPQTTTKKPTQNNNKKPQPKNNNKTKQKKNNQKLEATA